MARPFLSVEPTTCPTYHAGVGESDINTEPAAPDAARPRKKILRRFALLSGIVSTFSGVFLLVCYVVMIRMPGRSWTAPVPPMTAGQNALRDVLEADVRALAERIGQRNMRLPHRLERAADHIMKRYESLGYTARKLPFEVDGQRCHNIEAEHPGTDLAEQIIVLGAHYDTVPGCDGANDNASGVAALLALADAFAGVDTRRTIRFVGFVNEEPPYFQSEAMGSVIYARRCAQNEDNIIAMISLETMGYYSDAANSQRYPRPLNVFYPDVGNFVAVVGNIESRGLVYDVISSFRHHAQFPSEGVAAPAGVPGIGWSDHWSFWQVDYPAVMITDTAPFRYPHYHRDTDTADQLTYDHYARVVDALREVVADLAGRVNE